MDIQLEKFHIVFTSFFSDEITASFRRFGPLVVDWPHKAESKSYFPPKGYAFLLFQVSFQVIGRSYSYLVQLILNRTIFSAERGICAVADRRLHPGRRQAVPVRLLADHQGQAGADPAVAPLGRRLRA